MAHRIAPAASAALAQATALWPDRSRKSDGTIGDKKHRARRSWHNPSRPDGTPDPDGTVYAFDLTLDLAHGVDAHALVRAAVARRDPRVLEAISNRQIWTKARAAEGWRRYRGKNPHDKHAHVTVDPGHAEDTSPWWPVIVTPKPDQEDDMLTATQAKLLQGAFDRAAAANAAVDKVRREDVPALREQVTALTAKLDEAMARLPGPLDPDALTELVASPAVLSDADIERIAVRSAELAVEQLAGRLQS